MTNFDPGTEPLVAMPEQKRPSGCRIVLTLLVVFALLFMSASGAIWYFFFRGQADPPDEIDAPIVEATAVSPQHPDATIAEADLSTPMATADDDSINRIVYIGATGQVMTLAPDGSDERQLTSGSLRYQFPAWAPNGRAIAAIGVNRSGAGLFVLSDEADAEDELEPLYADGEQGPFYLYWSPDSSQVGFLATHPDGMGLHLVSADGLAESRLLTTGGPLYWQWAANSEEMLIHSGFSGEASRLEIVSAGGDGTGDTVALPGFFQVPGISADGRYLAYAEALTDSSSVTILDTESEDVVQQRHAGLVAMSWSPTANLLAFTNGTEPAKQQLCRATASAGCVFG